MPTHGLWAVVPVVLVLAAPATAQVANPDTVTVAVPALDHDVDRANILAAIEELEPGGTLQFAAGTYLVGERVRVPVPGVTILGHPAGTTLRGCEPSELERRARMECMGLELTGGRQTVRGLTFEHAGFDLILGCCIDPGEAPPSATPGGYLVEDNTFQASGVGVRVIAGPSETTVIRGNRFRDLFHAVGVNHGTVHIVDNDVSAPRPERVPGPAGHTGGAIIVSHRGQDACDGHEIAGNRIEDHPSAIVLVVFAPGTRCRGSVIRDNAIVVRRAHFTEAWPGIRVGSEADSTVVGVPIAVVNLVGSGNQPSPPAAGRGGEAVIGGHLIEGNRVMGAEGIGIEIRGSSGNRIVDNVVTGIEPRDPFPGNVANSADPEAWRDANGSGIWVSPGSEDNEIAGNTFEDVAGAEVFLAGDRNRVELQSPSDSVRDLGTGNEVSVADGAEGSDVAPEERIAGEADTVHVAPPTGEMETDRASILAALEQVQSGGTVQFAPGTYLVGEIISVTVPRVTLLGHSEGTTLRGCDPDRLGTREFARAHCNGLELAGGQQTVRGFTFEYGYWALHLGCCFGERAMLRAPDGTLVEGPAIYRTEGGHLVEGNTFRRSATGIRMNGDWTEPAIVRDNRFMDNWHSVSINGNTVHLVDNDFSVPEPERVPFYGFPNDAVQVGAPLPFQGGDETRARSCAHNVVAGNRIEGSHRGISIMLWAPGSSCRNNVIRDNTIILRRATVPSPEWFTLVDESDSTFVGTPLSLLNYPEAFGQNEPGQESAIEDNLIEGNRISDAEGLGIEILHASGNGIVNNTISGIAVRVPFPGNTMDARGADLGWRDANGSGIWVSPGSDGNEIAGNTFEDVAAHAVFLEGDRNRVELQSAADSVLDFGTGNRVTVPDPASEALDSRPGPTGLDPWPSDVPPGDTVRYTGIVNGMTGGERRMWREGPDTWAYSCDMARSCFPRTERLELDDDGLPVKLEVSGQKAPWDPWEERFERQGPVARWTTSVDEGEQPVEGPRFYAALHPAHDPGVLARALLRQPSRRLLLLPEGQARLEALGERTVERDGRTQTVRHYAVHGLDLKPAYVWLDEDGATFTDEWMVREGWESVFPQLKAASRAALADHVRDLARRLMPPPRDRPLAIRGARLFDPTTGSVRAGTTILVEGSRIAAVGADGSLPVPDEADVIDAAGRTVLPGLWDMHTHHGTGYLSFFRYRELDAPLHLAGGVTTARDLGSHIDELTFLRSRIESGEAIGPRLLAAGYIDGVGGSGTGVQVGTPEEARAAVDRFAELGYVQIKIYGELPADLVPVVIEGARGHGLRVSGHVPRSLSAREAVEAGFDELQHVGIFVSGILGSLDELIVRWEDDWEGWADAQVTLQPGSPAVREFVELLAAEDVALDPTLALALASEVPPHYIAPVLDRFPPQARRRLLDRSSLPSPLAMERRDAYVSSWTGFVRAAHEAGVQILPGTDLMPGFGLHRELELYVEAGIPEAEVLHLATLGPARVMGMDDELGSIEPGKLADLILVDGDPTADISDIRRVVTVIKDGRVYDPARIYRALGIRPCCEPQEDRQ